MNPLPVADQVVILGDGPVVNFRGDRGAPMAAIARPKLRERRQADEPETESCRRIGRWHYTHPLATLKPGSRGLHALMTCQVAHLTHQEAIEICGGLV